MTQEEFKRKKTELMDELTRQTEIRNAAIKEMNNIVKKIHKLESRFCEEHKDNPEFWEDEEDERV